MVHSLQVYLKKPKIINIYYFKNNENYNNNNLNSIFYGIGHEGIEVYFLVLNYFVYFIYFKKQSIKL